MGLLYSTEDLQVFGCVAPLSQQLHEGNMQVKTLTCWLGSQCLSGCSFGRYMTNTRIKLITVVDDESVKEDEVRSVSLAP